MQGILFETAPERGRALAQRWRGERPIFLCVLAHTDTCLIPGISAAGTTEQIRPYTPAADAEALVYGTPRCIRGLPSNPLGPPGPAGITRAALQLAGLQPRFVAAGLRVLPDVAVQHVPCSPGGSIDQGRGVPEARALYQEGQQIGQGLVGKAPYLVLAESVPGGTTTALALLLALGVDAWGRVSGSSPDNNHPLKNSVVCAGLAAAGLRPGDGLADPLRSVEAIGDPMQPLAAGIACAALRGGLPVLFAGGSQMLAVAALLAACEGADILRESAVGTTRWVSRDPHGDVRGLATDVSADLPLLSADLDFTHSRHPELRPYERFLVKEGVGAGGAAIAALLVTGAPPAELHRAIDDAYDLVL